MIYIDFSIKPTEEEAASNRQRLEERAKQIGISVEGKSDEQIYKEIKTYERKQG